MTTTLADTAVTIRERLAAARAKLDDANALRDSRLVALIEAVCASVPYSALPRDVQKAATAVREATAQRDEARTMVDILVRDAAIATEVADPTAVTSEQRARVEALIARHVFGHEIVHVGANTARPWRRRQHNGRDGRSAEPIPHYASDLVACREAEARVDGLRFVRVLINGVLALDRHEGRREVALAVLRATPFERALAVLGAVGVDAADDPCEVSPCP
jgi:hypothetical protein